MEAPLGEIGLLNRTMVAGTPPGKEGSVNESRLKPTDASAASSDSVFRFHIRADSAGHRIGRLPWSRRWLEEPEGVLRRLARRDPNASRISTTGCAESGQSGVHAGRRSAAATAVWAA